jgi:hypothetical protein
VPSNSWLTRSQRLVRLEQKHSPGHDDRRGDLAPNWLMNQQLLLCAPGMAPSNELLHIFLTRLFLQVSGRLSSDRMNDIDQIVNRLRQFATELVRGGRASDAAAVLAGIGALEILELFSTSGQPQKPLEAASSSNGGQVNGEQYG